MSFTAKDVQNLRQASGAGMMDAKRALEETDGDFDAAAKLLREKGLAKSVDRADRENTQGVVAVATAPGAAAIVELKCETDFVAKTPEFQALVKDIAMHVAASSPLYVNKEDVPAQVLEKEKEIYRAQAAGQRRLRETCRVPSPGAELALRGERDERHDDPDQHVRQAHAEQRAERTAQLDLTSVQRRPVESPRQRGAECENDPGHGRD